jgi:peptidoglycan/xylan/chitin deacetylase (PgdA/CDA1 family)
VNKRIKTYRFPYFFIVLTLAIAIFYRSPQGSGISTVPVIDDSAIDRRSAISPPEAALPAVRRTAATTQPLVSAPSGTLSADLSRVVAPSVRKSTMPESARAASTSRAPEVPVPVKEKVYLPDSYSHALPVTPTEVRPKSGSPSRVSVISHGDENLNQVALTFDDGPNRKHTPQILDILKQYNVKGTFFVLGEQVKENPAVLQRVVEEGHEVGNHSFSHPQFKSLTEEQVRRELVSTQEEIRKVVGFVPKLLRPPYGAYRPATLTLFEELGLHVILWSVDTNDWRRKADAIARTVTKDGKNGSIILFHDSKTVTVRVLPQIIEELKARGLQPVTISEMTGIPAYDRSVPIAKSPTPESGT